MVELPYMNFDPMSKSGIAFTLLRKRGRLLAIRVLSGSQKIWGTSSLLWTIALAPIPYCLI